VACNACGSHNPPGNRFCGECGAALAAQCPACGASSQPGQKFCGQCGGALQAGGSAVTVGVPAQPGPPTSENRPVAVLFVDLVGFTTLSETRDAEDVRELLSRYFDIARTIIGRYGGSVEKFIGDAVMAVWGVPAAREDDAERAVRAALEVVEAVGALGAEIGVDLAARGGVVTGSVAAWTAPGEGLVAGDRVNTAARVQSVATAGSVFVDENTRRATSAAIAYADAGEHAVKGKAEPLQLWRAERVVAGVGGSQRVDGLEARFIGRDADLRLVKELFHQCIDRASARLVSVVGVAGVGKSRLRWEFDKYIDGLADFVQYHSGRCLSYGDGVAYWALAEMVRQRFQVAEDDPEDVASARLAEGLLTMVPDPAERELLEPRLGALLGIGEVELGREELFAGWRLFFERLAEDETVVLVFEDLQWADGGLLDFIDYLLDWAADSPIFVLTFARPELAEARPGWPAGRRNATSLYLEPLSATDMAALLDDLVADLPSSLRQRIVERSEGIPLYAVETVRSLIDRDVVLPQDGVYRLVGDAGDLDVPTSLTSLIAARIDALPADERTLVKDLAVLGGGFPRAAVAAVSDLDDALLDRLLADLVRKEFLSVRSDKLSPDRGQYVFAQTLLRTVAYDMLSKRERKARHLAIAAHLRATFENDGEDVAEVVAAHYRDALLAAESDPDAAEIRREALAAYERGGRRAFLLGAPETALRIYTTAAQLADDEDVRFTLRERAAEMALASGRHQQTYELYSQLREDLAAAGRHRDWLRLVVGHARGHARMGRQVEAIETLEEVVPELDDGTYSPELAHVSAWLANFLVYAGRIAAAEPYIEKALVTAQALALPESMCQALITRGTALVFQDRVPEGLIHAEAAIDIARRHGLTDVEQNALIITSDIAMTDDRPEAVEYSLACMEAARRLGTRYSETIAASNLLYALLYTGDWARLERTLAELLDAGGPDRPQVEYLHTRSAMLAAWRGDVAAAAAAYELVASASRDSDSVDDIATLAMLETMIATADGRYAEAVERARPALDRMLTEIAVHHEALRPTWVAAMEAQLQLGDLDATEKLYGSVADLPPGFLPPYLQAEAARFGAHIAAAHGDAEGAARGFAEAEAALDALGYVYWVARCRLDHAEWLAHEDPGQANELAGKAAETFDQLGATVWADRSRRLVRERTTV
jgi:class 3 adenylate cyclase/tetratricopeptide (TPR) repeat protein